jgi:hypothetical protein
VGTRPHQRGNPAQKPVEPAQPELPFDPPLPPVEPRKRSRKRAQQVRELMATTGRSERWARQLLKLLESGNARIIGKFVDGRISVNRAEALIDPGIAPDRALSRRFNAASRSVREQLVSLID